MLKINYLLVGIGVLLSGGTIVSERSAAAFLITPVPYIGSIVAIRLKVKNKIEYPIFFA